MNKARREELRRALDMLNEARMIIESMQQEEQEALDNLPEGLQESDRGTVMASNAERLEDVAYTLDEQEQELEDIIDG